MKKKYASYDVIVLARMSFFGNMASERAFKKYRNSIF
jgi:hypothetical protein